MIDPHKALSYQQALATFTRILDEVDSAPRLLQNAAAQVARITGIKHVKALRYRPDHGDLLIEAGVSWRPGVVGHVSFGADRHSAPGRSLQTGQPVVVQDIRNNPDFRYAEVLREHGIVSVCNVPIFVKGSHWGVLEVDTEEEVAFDEFDVRSLSIFANIIGLSLAHRFAEAEALRAVTDTSATQTHTEILLRELQHRMKNNLQLVVSFLGLQLRQTKNEEARERISAVMDRVLAIGLAHDQLSFKANGSSVNMKANDVSDTLTLALQASGLDTAKVVHRPPLLSDNGSSYIAGNLAEWLKDQGFDHVRGAPLHPQTQGKIERWHQTLKNCILLENYYLPGDLEAQINAFVDHYNNRRYHEAIGNLTPADVYFGRGNTILLERERIKRQTIQNRRLMHARLAA